ncbi:DUF3365 domain-containing protein [Colwellia sp. MB02u-9]|uniref:Tll0287-like domain-containing protein n=1 Tax=Colwellia sp. MB02u-9 TaxID=2759823 RepID=UPI001C70E758|nr:DUF3365 domain-containing protein [Colwellia sp. MB02u-9]
MKLISINLLLTSVLVMSPLLVNADETLPMQDIQQARSLVKAFGSDLKSVLITTMKTAGPIKALEVCNTQAGAIAEKNSALSAWNIARTSLKVRNTSNAPDVWEATILRQFEIRKAAGEDINTMEHSEVVQVGEKTVLRYMKAIPTGGLCLACHGSKLADDVSNKVNALYPNDQATGFKLGDIRGAFTLQKIKL